MKDDFTNKKDEKVEIVGEESEKPDFLEFDNETYEGHYVITIERWIFWFFVIIFVTNCNNN